MFWMDKGVDGFRVDMAASLVKNDFDKSATIKLWKEDLAKWFKETYPEGVLIAEWFNPAQSIEAGFDIDFFAHDGVYNYSTLFFNTDRRTDAPAVFVTAYKDYKFIERAREMGVEDYITKPFNPLELIARVKSAYRRYTRYNEKNEDNIIYIDGLEIDQDKHICRLYDNTIELTPMEFDILLYLAQKRGNVVSSEELFEKVWKEKYLDNNNTVMVHIRRIREKLKEDSKKPKFIKTVWGVGYKIEE